MKLDYNLKNYNSHYDYVRGEIWLSKQELCDEVSEFLGIDIPLETNVTVTKEQMERVHKFLLDKGNLIGMYGDKFLND